jgi:hypothetical protein
MASNIAVENANASIAIEAGDIQIGAVEIKDGTTDARQTVRVDNATATATPTVAIAGAIYKDSLDTYADNDASPLHTDVNGRLLTATTLGAETTKVIGTVNVAASQSIAVTQSTATSLKAQVVGAGTAGTADSNPVTIQGIAAMTPVIVTGDSAGSLTVDGTVTANGGGTAGTPNAGVMSVQGITSGTDLNVKISDRASTVVTAIDGVTLDDEPTAVTSSAINMTGYQRVGIFWQYDETEVGGGVTGTLTVEVSPDNTNWFSAPFFDTAGGATPQTSEVLSDDGSYICWLDKNIPFPYLRVTVTGANTDADDTILTTVKVYMDK